MWIDNIFRIIFKNVDFIICIKTEFALLMTNLSKRLHNDENLDLSINFYVPRYPNKTSP